MNASRAESSRGPRSATLEAPVVNTFTEWGPLEEVIVGRVDGAHVPSWEPAVAATVPAAARPFFVQNGGRPFPAEDVRGAGAELDAFARLLEGEGVRVRRPDVPDFSRSYSTPDWASPSGVYAAMPRDVILAVGDKLVEAPMAWRSRYFEADAFRPLLREYFSSGADWIAAPKPRLSDASFAVPQAEPGEAPLVYATTEAEPLFDAADFVRCGRDLFAQRSHVTNVAGIEWVARLLGPEFRVHVVATADDKPMHIDATLMPLRPGLVLINPQRLPVIPDAFRSWRVVEAAPPAHPRPDDLYMCSSWVSMNVLMLDEKRVVVEAQEKPTIDLLSRHGFDVIPCAFRTFYRFGGSFHCATLDVRRDEELESYL